MSIGGSKLQSAVFHLEVDTGEDLFGFIATAGKQRAAQSFSKRFAAQQEGLAVLSQGQLREIFSGETPHLVAPGQR